MSAEIAVQYAVDLPGLPSEAQLLCWARTALGISNRSESELAIRIVDETESSSLNHTYRHKHGPTNVLSFPFQPPIAQLPQSLLGDVVICAPVVAREASIQQKTPDAHWAHMVIHGVLHLIGYDHQQDPEARAMEALEVKLLAQLGYPNPYGDENEL